MYEIKTKYKGQGEGVVGAMFSTVEDAEQYLTASGWKRDRYSSDWCKEGPVRMVGMLGMSIMEYVSIESA